MRVSGCCDILRRAPKEPSPVFRPAGVASCAADRVDEVRPGVGRDDGEIAISQDGIDSRLDDVLRVEVDPAGGDPDELRPMLLEPLDESGRNRGKAGKTAIGSTR